MRGLFRCCAVAAALTVASVSLGQMASTAASSRSGGLVSVNKARAPRVNRLRPVPTPKLDFSGFRAVNARPREWLVFDVLYSVPGSWIDELEVNFYVMLRHPNPETRKVEFSFFRSTVAYRDVVGERAGANFNRSGDHVAGMVLHPNGWMRYGDPSDSVKGLIGFAVEFSVKGKVIDQYSDIKPGCELAKVKDWWKNDQVLSSDAVKTLDGYLMERGKTPFALVNPDDYEMVK